MKRHLTLINDLQFGSTGKGLLAGYLALRDNPDTLVTAWYPNAGHTYIDGVGRKYIHTMLANGVVSPSLRNILIGPGSGINMDSLLSEIEANSDHLANVNISIHANAVVVTQRHRDEEEGPMTKIGSTKKGCGAAAIQRIRRNPSDMNIADELVHKHPLANHVRVVSPKEYDDILDSGKQIQVEGAQGYSLSMYHGFYPYCTSRDVTTAQIMADCGIPAKGFANVTVIGTARTYPIRVANRYDDKGVKLGWSGPHYHDQIETSFKAIGRDVELTTVTKLPRRIFTFSKEQITGAIRQNGVDEVFLNFAQYPSSANALVNIVSNIENAGAPVRYLGFGPTLRDVESLKLNLGVFHMSEIARLYNEHKVA